MSGSCWRDRPSYTIETLESLRAELGSDVSLVLCMGADAFAGLPSWHRWQELLALAHILVIDRPGWDLPEVGAAAELLARCEADGECLSAAPAGSIVRQTLRLLPISATEIRAQIASGHSAQFLVPEAVWQYIATQHLYR